MPRAATGDHPRVTSAARDQPFLPQSTSASALRHTGDALENILLEQADEEHAPNMDSRIALEYNMIRSRAAQSIFPGLEASESGRSKPLAVGIEVPLILHPSGESMEPSLNANRRTSRWKS
jgi:hypothetical protein